MNTGKNGIQSLSASPESDSDAVTNDPWQWWRRQMPVTRRWAYFDHAAVAPLSQPAADAITELTRQAAEEGDTVWPKWARRVEQLRQWSAELLHCSQAEIAIVPNTTTGINYVAEGWGFQSGDNIILPEGEFPSNLFPWQNQRDRGVEVRIVPRRDGRVEIDDLIEQVDSATRLIAVSWVGYASGYRIDVESLVQRAHEKGVLVFLDAIQGLGMYPLDLQKVPVDFLAADGHKWLLGPEGAGIAMIRQEHLARLRCTNVGWGSVKNSHNYASPQFELKESAARYESGSANMIGASALAASMDMFLRVRREHGEQAIGERVIALASELDRELQRLGVATRLPKQSACRSGIVTFDVPGVEPNQVRQAALEKGVVVSCRGGGVRASIHAYNDASDLERLIDVVRSFV